MVQAQPPLVSFGPMCCLCSDELTVVRFASVDVCCVYFQLQTRRAKCFGICVCFCVDRSYDLEIVKVHVAIR